MPANGLSVGVDYSFGVWDGTTQTLVDLGDVQNVKVTKMNHNLVSRPYNQPPRFAHIPDGYKISFSCIRTGPDLENFALNSDLSFEGGTVMKGGYLNETVNEIDGSQSRYQYQGLDIVITEISDVAREKVVMMSVECMASSKKPVT